MSAPGLRARPVGHGRRRVEGSPDSRLALRWAAEAARRRGAALRVAHAYRTAGGPPGVEHLDRCERELMDVAVREAATTAPGVDVVPDLARDEAAASALVARAARADLLVVGCRGPGGFTGLLVGSVSDQCARNGPCPVAVIRPSAEASRFSAAPRPAAIREDVREPSVPVGPSGSSGGER